MKKTIKTLTLILLALAAILCFASCKEDQSTDLWADAIYTEDTELGQGEKTLTLELKVDDKTVVFTVNTDKTTVGDALLEHNLIEGDESEYGLYIKKVNGITADYDVNKSYWAFYIDGEYALSGVDSTEIDEDAKYSLEYTKE